MKTTRNTVQRALVLDAVRRLSCHAAADDIYEVIAAEHPHISRATVYRNLNLLSESGEIKKLEVPGGADRFDHRTFSHYHARCLTCGRIFDVEMEYMENLSSRISDVHGFAVTGHDLIFRGTCPDCLHSSSAEDPDSRP